MFGKIEGYKMISKELLSEVLREPIYAEPYIKGDELFWVRFYLPNVDDGIEQEVSINMYELAHRCKEWAIKYNYFISSFVSHCMQDKGEATAQDENGNKKVFVCDTEPEAIFKACELIMEQTK